MFVFVIRYHQVLSWHLEKVNLQKDCLIFITRITFCVHRMFPEEVLKRLLEDFIQLCIFFFLHNPADKKQWKLPCWRWWKMQDWIDDMLHSTHVSVIFKPSADVGGFTVFQAWEMHSDYTNTNPLSRLVCSVSKRATRWPSEPSGLPYSWD